MPYPTQMRFSAFSQVFATELPSADAISVFCRAMPTSDIRDMYLLTIPDQGKAHLYIQRKHEEIKECQADVELFSTAIYNHSKAAEETKDAAEMLFHDNMIRESMASVEDAKERMAVAQQGIQDMEQNPIYLKFQAIYALNRGRAEGLSHKMVQRAVHTRILQQVYHAMSTCKPPPLEHPAIPAAPAVPAAVALPPLRGAAAQARMGGPAVGAAAAAWLAHDPTPMPKDMTGYACRRRLVCDVPNGPHTRIDATGFLRYNLRDVQEFKAKPRWRESNAYDLHLLDYLHTVGPRMELLMEIHYSNHRASDKVFCIICLCLIVVCVQTRRDKAVAAIDRAIEMFRVRDQALDPVDWHTVRVDDFLRF